jgi:hypothetical protein
MIKALIKKLQTLIDMITNQCIDNLHPSHEGEELHPLEVTFGNES